MLFIGDRYLKPLFAESNIHLLYQSVCIIGRIRKGGLYSSNQPCLSRPADRPHQQWRNWRKHGSYCTNTRPPKWPILCRVGR